MVNECEFGNLPEKGEERGEENEGERREMN